MIYLKSKWNNSLHIQENEKNSEKNEVKETPKFHEQKMND